MVSEEVNMAKCPQCQSENPLNAVYCIECGCKIDKTAAEYKKVQYLGILGIALFLPLALISGLYLYTRPECATKRRGIDIILVSIALWVFYAVVLLYSSFYIHS
jgi:hypothetical protein